MYLARKNIGNQAHYSIRETYRDADCLKSRDLFHPDQGGSQETFVKLKKLYENLMKKKNRK